MPQILVALDYTLGKPQQIVIAGERDAEDTGALLREVHGTYSPNKIVLLADTDGAAFLAAKLPALREMNPIDGQATAYVCENFTCRAPVTDPAELRALLQQS
jgi:hypothetical protein